MTIEQAYYILKKHQCNDEELKKAIAVILEYIEPDLFNDL